MSEYKYDADICRENGWGVGTGLIGDADTDPIEIEITAVGLKLVVAALVYPDSGGEIHPADEGTWTLQCREWRKVEPGSASAS